jgi:hypothetical protein
MIVMAGPARSSSIYKLLSSKALVYVGNISFSLYLWHWPILVYFQSRTGTTPGELTVTEGLFVIVMAFGMSIASKTLIEQPTANFRKGGVFARYFLGVIFFVPVFSFSYFVRSELVRIYDEARYTDYVNGDYYEGERAYVQSGPADIGLSRMIGLNYDLTPASLHGCSAGLADDEINICEFGDIFKSDTVLLVGGSRIAQWEPFLPI